MSWLAAIVSLVLISCASSDHGATPDTQLESMEVSPIVGVTSQEEILKEMPQWIDDLVQAQPDQAQAQRLAEPVPGAEVLVFFGSWCSDSQRELTRLWRAVEMAGGSFGFPVRYIGVDRNKTEPAGLLDGAEILYVPTLVVMKDGVESGRVIESAPGGIEKDLLALVSGEVSGWLTGRDDLETPELAKTQ